MTERISIRELRQRVYTVVEQVVLDHAGLCLDNEEEVNVVSTAMADAVALLFLQLREETVHVPD
jgi:hypothetical protein